MNQHEIEKRYQKEVHQSIPDMDALWQKIENRLPEQEISRQESGISQKRNSIQMQRFAGAAACLLIVAAGASVVFGNTGLHQMHSLNKSDTPQQDGYEDAPAQEGNADAAENEGFAADDAFVKQEQDVSGKPLTYADLAVSDSAELQDSVNLQLLGMEQRYFVEQAVLEQTNAFADVVITDGTQDARTGEITYTMEVRYSIGDAKLPSTLTLKSQNAYLMEKHHEYLIPMQSLGGTISLANEVSPQIEVTEDGKAVLHSGWHEFLPDTDTPVLYETLGDSDYFYDRMYLAEMSEVLVRVEQWAETI